MDEDYIPFEDRLDIPEGYRNIGFTFVGNDTWLPKSLYEDRERQRRRLRQGSERGIVWTR